jgi:hypothetical protein
MQTDDRSHKDDSTVRTELDELLIELLGEGLTHQRVAETAEISTKTVQRRLSDPGFAAAVSRRRRERVAQISGRLISASDRAVDVLREALDTDDAKVSLRAAALVLDHGHRFQQSSEERELARRQDELEERLQAAIESVAGLKRDGRPGAVS